MLAPNREQVTTVCCKIRGIHYSLFSSWGTVAISDKHQRRLLLPPRSRGHLSVSTTVPVVWSVGGIPGWGGLAAPWRGAVERFLEDPCTSA